MNLRTSLLLHGRSEKPFSISRLLLAGLRITLLAVIIASCDKNDKQAPPPTAPLVTTAALTNVNIGFGSATAGGSIVSDGGDTITQTGIVWSKSNVTPTLDDSVVAGIGGSGTFTADINGLDFDNTYYFRAFATNSVGTGYGSVVTLNTSADSVKFTYNGSEVVYGVIVSPTTGRKWLDRNLGAKQVATAADDYQAYGDLFQWGRPADGHQLINWTSSTTGTPVNGTTTTLATTDNPAHSDFIMSVYAGSPISADWRSDNNGNRWATMPQGPCPAGWHVPTVDEFAAETNSLEGTPFPSGGTATSGGIEDAVTAFSLLKLTSAGYRKSLASDNGKLVWTGTDYFYWTSSDIASSSSGFRRGIIYQIADSQVLAGPQDSNRYTKGSGLSVRCIKD